MKNKKPIIGISGTFVMDGSGRFPAYKKSCVNDDYINAVLNSGGVPVIIPATHDKEAIKAQLAMVDGVILSGGEDVEPRRFGEEQLAKLGDVSPYRDEFDYMLLDEATKQGKKVMGICRGFQIITAYFGGSLYQDLDYTKGASLKHDQWSNSDLPSHKVVLEKESNLFKIFGKKEYWVNSFHHLALKDVPKGFKVTATATDGVIEAIEREKDYMVGYQWHPEMMAAKGDKGAIKIFKDFFKKL